MEEFKVKQEYTPTILDFEAGLDTYEQSKEALKRWRCHSELLEQLKNAAYFVGQLAPGIELSGVVKKWNDAIAKAEDRA